MHDKVLQDKTNTVRDFLQQIANAQRALTAAKAAYNSAADDAGGYKSPNLRSASQTRFYDVSDNLVKVESAREMFKKAQKYLSESLEILDEVISVLDAKKQDVLLLKYTCGKTFAQIGQTLLRSRSTIKTWHRSAIIEIAQDAVAMGLINDYVSNLLK